MFIALAVATALSGCATLSRYEQSLTPSAPATTPSSSPALREAEARGYQEGLEAGKRIQARHDHVVDQAERDKAATAASAMAQEAVQETQGMQALNKLCTVPTPPAAKPVSAPASAPATANAAAAASAAAAMKANPPDVFAPSGPARPLVGSPDPF